MAKIMTAIEFIYVGDPGRAQAEFQCIWSSIGQEPDPLHVCVLSHFMADLQQDVLEELYWDLRALNAAGKLTDERLQRFHPSLTVARFLPSLHLNVADSAFRAGDFEIAQRHLKTCIELEPGLSASPFDTLTRNGIKSLLSRIASTCPEIARADGLSERSQQIS